MGQAHRSKDFGKSIFNELLKHVKQTGCNRIESDIFFSDPALKFYEKVGALNTIEISGYHSYRVHKDVINSIDL